VPFRAPGAASNLEKVISSDHVHGDGPFTSSATSKLVELTGASAALLTTSGTSALEMAVRLLDVGYGDEVILPSFTFSSGASSIVAAGATPVFVDIEGDSGNIDPSLVEAAITPRTKAISVMHYGGQPVDMAAIATISKQYGIPVLEDNAHGLGVDSRFGNLGTLSDVAIQSFHDTKNVHCGEGGAVLINNLELLETAEIMREKGTNRSKFIRGQVDKYTWVDWGSSYLPSELNAAVLDAQLDCFDDIQNQRFSLWNAYSEYLTEWSHSVDGTVMTPVNGEHAAHMFYLTLKTEEERNSLLQHINYDGIRATFHYVPLHSAPAGLKYGRISGSMEKTESFSSRLLRLPLWPGMTEVQLEKVLSSVKSWKRN
jgi:dTDP-4-amino-4,6-dideoxygalactose transaminase